MGYWLMKWLIEGKRREEGEGEEEKEKEKRRGREEKRREEREERKSNFFNEKFDIIFAICFFIFY